MHLLYFNHFMADAKRMLPKNAPKIMLLKPFL